jgi:nucleoside-triphosphatase
VVGCDSTQQQHVVADILLISGRPGVGKTTVIRRLADAIRNQAGGFYTEEIRKSGKRIGFRLVTLRGRSATFAHADWAARTPHRVGRYGVDTSVLDRIGVQAIRQALRYRRVILVDEIGRMELFSDAFRAVMDDAASGPAPLVATITVAPHPWAEDFKRRPRVTLHELTRGNRDRILEVALTWLRKRTVMAHEGETNGQNSARSSANV